MFIDGDSVGFVTVGVCVPPTEGRESEGVDVKDKMGQSM